MKKLMILVSTLLVITLLSGCSNNSESDENTLVVSCTLDPHAKILEEAKPILLEDYGITLEIEVLDAYEVFNRALDGGDVDANYFQHLPYFNGEKAEFGYDIVNAGGIHIEPFGIYSSKITDLSALEDGAQIIISNSVADNGRILSILAQADLIAFPEGVDSLNVTIADIDNEVNNPHGFEFVEIKPELLIQTYNNGEGDLVAINGNYALQGGLDPLQDALILEDASETNPYVNIVATTTALQEDARIKALVEVLQSETIVDFINDTYNGSVIPVSK